LERFSIPHPYGNGIFWEGEHSFWKFTIKGGEKARNRTKKWSFDDESPCGFGGLGPPKPSKTGDRETKPARKVKLEEDCWKSTKIKLFY
jgi:hypothetical protein